MKTKNYWLKEIIKSNELSLDLKMEQVSFPSEKITLYEVSYKSLYDEVIHGWFIEPKGEKNYPLVIDFIGYMNHLVSPLQFSEWLHAGCAVLVTDSRGQGGKTLDSHPYETVEEERLMACGILDKDDFYLRRLYWDALRLIDVSQELPLVDKEKVFIHGTSQGGGVGIFANSMTPHQIKYGFYDVPSHSNLSHRVEKGTGSYRGIHDYLEINPDKKEMIEELLSYFDVKEVVDQIKNPILVSVGEADPICPKEDFYPAYERVESFKEIDVYEEAGHGGGGHKHIEKILTYLLKEVDGE
ncbi:MAG: acetylxylan esterase [Vagococcus sp.]|uniref:acetylxylan esterase n=1 Tax=Vagococcus TaxID=2737 RepID=UPI002FC6E494